MDWFVLFSVPPLLILGRRKPEKPTSLSAFWFLWLVSKLHPIRVAVSRTLLTSWAEVHG